jgi:hypothetical protein
MKGRCNIGESEKKGKKKGVLQQTKEITHLKFK